MGREGQESQWTNDGKSRAMDIKQANGKNQHIPKREQNTDPMD